MLYRTLILTIMALFVSMPCMAYGEVDLVVVPQIGGSIGRNGTLILKNVSAEDNITLWSYGAAIREISYSLYEYHASNAANVSFYVAVNNQTYVWNFSIYSPGIGAINESNSAPPAATPPPPQPPPPPPETRSMALDSFLDEFYDLVMILLCGAVVYMGLYGFRMMLGER